MLMMMIMRKVITETKPDIFTYTYTFCLKLQKTEFYSSGLSLK